FEIDELRCVVCGLCVEACPCDAIRMDTGQHAPAVAHRADAVYGKVDLLKLAAQSIAKQGVKDPTWREAPPAARSIARPEEASTATASSQGPRAIDGAHRRSYSAIKPAARFVRGSIFFPLRWNPGIRR